MLHVVNGEATTIPVEGNRLYWFDFMMEGPLGVAWEQRAEYLHQHFGVVPAAYLEAKDRALAKLGSCGGHEEIVLWFEGDLFCLMNLAFVLDWLSAQPLDAVRLTAVCPPEERLGPLAEARLSELFAQRMAVSSAALELGHKIWHWLLGGPQPTDFTAWPLLERIVQLRARRQAGEIERTILGLLTTEPRKLGLVFRDFNVTDLGYALGMGDLQFAALVVGMQPGITIVPSITGPPYENCGKWELSLCA